MYFIRVTVLISVLSLSFCAKATVDVIYTGHQQLAKNINQEYNYRIIEMALKVTEPEFGEYKIVINGNGSIPKQRALEQIVKKNGLFNVVLVPTQPEWEEKAIPIRIPVRMGLLNYRMLVIHKDNIDKFKAIDTPEALKSVPVGLRKTWSTWEMMQSQGFNVVNAYTYDSLFAMLEMKRFDYIPRGIYEVYDEIESKITDYPNIAVEPHLVIVIPTPYYAFVSPHEPRIAKRIEAGLEIMMEKGIIRDMLKEHYGDAIKRAKLNSRTVIHIENETLSAETPLDRKDYWIDLLTSPIHMQPNSTNE